MQVIGAGMAMTRLEVGGNGSAGAVARGTGMAPSYPGGVRSFKDFPAALAAAPPFLAPSPDPFLTPSSPPTMPENKRFKFAGVMGMPVLQSRSPIIHNFWIREHGLNAAYGHLPVRIERIHEAVRGLSALGLAGCNITQPHKLAAIGLMDVLSPLARRIGAINCIVVKDDGQGFSTAQPRKPTSFGLMGLRERAYLLNGEAHIQSLSSNLALFTAPIQKMSLLGSLLGLLLTLQVAANKAVAPDIESIIERFRARAQALPPGTWITGRGYNEAELPESAKA